MHRYIPSKSPDPARWLALTESERIELVVEAHRKERLNPDALRMHAMLQAVVETQLATSDPPAVPLALARLCADGMSRHDALHAIVSVLVENLYAAFGADRSGVQAPLPEAYADAVSKITRQSWLESQRGDS
jgi:hypothetical protein